jgi:hypothetical protein
MTFKEFMELRKQYEAVKSPDTLEDFTDAEVEFAFDLYRKFPDIIALVDKALNYITGGLE